MDLSRKRDRDRLKPRTLKGDRKQRTANDTPYWQKIGEGAYLGFRVTSGTWYARVRDKAGKQHYTPFGDLIGVSDPFVEAKKRAEEWLSTVTGTAVRSVKRGTVRAALEAYLAQLRREERPDAADEALWRFKLVVWSDPLADIKLEKATRDDFEEWRDRQRKGRQPRTVNRNVRAVVAGLNAARKQGHVGNPDAWKLNPLQDAAEDEADPVFLGPKRRAAIIAKASPELGLFLRGLELTGARPKELAAATSDDLDGQKLCLRHKKGRPPKVRVRYFVLGDDSVEFFKQQAKGKLHAPLFTRPDGEPWTNNYWARMLRKAIKAVNAEARGDDRIPAGASAYSFRHDRISELLQKHRVDPVTVAAQCGTSVAMIERYYFKFIESAMQEKLAAIRSA